MRMLKLSWVLSCWLVVLGAGEGAEEEVIKHEKIYRNPEYLYSIRIPPGVMCISAPPPVPQHGCGMQLSQEPTAYLWVDGSYNTLDRVSPRDVLRDHYEGLLQEGTTVVVLKRASILLGNLPAERLTVRYQKAGDTEATVKDVVVTLREVKGYGDMIYTIGLISPESRFANDDKIFESILQSWMNEPSSGGP